MSSDLGGHDGVVWNELYWPRLRSPSGKKNMDRTCHGGLSKTRDNNNGGGEKLLNKRCEPGVSSEYEKGGRESIRNTTSTGGNSKGQQRS